MPKVNQRGMSLGRSKIIAGAGFRWPSKFEKTSVQKIHLQDCRKSCFQDIDEPRVTKVRGKSLSFSPISRKTTASKIGAQKQAVTIIGGSKRPVKKQGKVLGSIEPKKLFKEGEKSVPNKKP